MQVFRRYLKDFYWRLKDIGNISKQLVFYAKAELKNHKNKLITISIIKVIIFISGLLMVYISKPTLDEGLLGKNWHLFIGLSLLAGLLFIITSGLGLLSTLLTQDVKNKFSSALHNKAANRFYGLNLLETKKFSAAEKAYLLDYDCDIMSEFIFTEIPCILSLPKILVFFTIAFFLSWKLTLFALLFIPIYALEAIIAGKRRRQLRQDNFLAAKEYSSYMQESFLNIKLIKAFSKEISAIKKCMEFLKEKLKAQFRYFTINSKISFFDNLINKTAMGLFWLFGGYLIITKKITLGTFSAVAIYFTLIISEFSSLSSFFQSSFEDINSLRRSIKFIKHSSSHEKSREVRQLESITGQIKVNSLWFGYSRDKTVLKDASFIAESGKWTAIGGPSGCGKTTLISLILGLFYPLGGDILLDGIDIATIDKQSLSKHISVALQEPLMWNDTIFNNIAWAAQNFSKESIYQAARLSCLDSFIQDLPLKYDTDIGEGGFCISEGQKQRIAIARALIRNPKILILDEATSSIDIETENKIFNNIKETFPKTTVILVSHRPQSLVFADTVYRMQEGRLYKEEALSSNIAFDTTL